MPEEQVAGQVGDVSNADAVQSAGPTMPDSQLASQKARDQWRRRPNDDANSATCKRRPIGADESVWINKRLFAEAETKVKDSDPKLKRFVASLVRAIFPEEILRVSAVSGHRSFFPGVIPMPKETLQAIYHEVRRQQQLYWQRQGKETRGAEWEAYCATLGRVLINRTIFATVAAARDRKWNTSLHAAREGLDDASPSEDEGLPATIEAGINDTSTRVFGPVSDEQVTQLIGYVPNAADVQLIGPIPDSQLGSLLPREQWNRLPSDDANDPTCIRRPIGANESVWIGKRLFARAEATIATDSAPAFTLFIKGLVRAAVPKKRLRTSAVSGISKNYPDAVPMPMEILDAIFHEVRLQQQLHWRRQGRETTGAEWENYCTTMRPVDVNRAIAKEIWLARCRNPGAALRRFRQERSSAKEAENSAAGTMSKSRLSRPLPTRRPLQAAPPPVSHWPFDAPREAWRRRPTDNPNSATRVPIGADDAVWIDKTALNTAQLNIKFGGDSGFRQGVRQLVRGIVAKEDLRKYCTAPTGRSGGLLPLPREVLDALCHYLEEQQKLSWLEEQKLKRRPINGGVWKASFAQVQPRVIFKTVDIEFRAARTAYRSALLGNAACLPSASGYNAVENRRSNVSAPRSAGERVVSQESTLNVVETSEETRTTAADSNSDSIPPIFHDSAEYGEASHHSEVLADATPTSAPRPIFTFPDSMFAEPEVSRANDREASTTNTGVQMPTAATTQQVENVATTATGSGRSSQTKMICGECNRRFLTVIELENHVLHSHVEGDHRTSRPMLASDARHTMSSAGHPGGTTSDTRQGGRFLHFSLSRRRFPRTPAGE